MNPTSHILNELRAETLLEGSHVLSQIEILSKGLKYKTSNHEVGFEDFFGIIQQEISSLPRLELESSITPGTESQYQVQLVTALEKIFDASDLVLNRLLFFQSKLRAALQQANVLEVTFIAWYSIAVAEALENYKTVKLTSTVIKALAQAEFGRLMNGVNIDLETLTEATKILSKQIQSHKSVAQEKYNLGKDQVNASWTSQNLPAEGLADSDGALELIRVESEEEDNTSIPVYAPRLGPGKERIAEITKETEKLVESITEELTVRDMHQIEEKQLAEGRPVFPTSDEHPPKNCPPCINPKICRDLDRCMLEPVPVNQTEVISEKDPGNEILVSDDKVLASFGEGMTLENFVITATNAEGKDISVVKFVQPGAGVIVTRTKDGYPDKIKCNVCHHRIRIGQEMYGNGSGWAHAVGTDCLNKGKEEIANILGVPVEQIHTLSVTPEQVVEVQKDQEIKGTFIKQGDPAPVISMGEVSEATVVSHVSDQFEPISEEPSTAITLALMMEQNSAVIKPPRRKLEILSEDENI